jgi:glycosyltransferase involved in cell wall biosynthesis
VSELAVALVGRYRVPFPYERHRQDLEVMRALARRTGRLELLVVDAEGIARTWQDGSLTVHYAPRRIGFFLWAIRCLRKLRSKGQLDLVNGSDLIGGLVALAARAGFGTAAVAQLQGQFFRPVRGTPHRLRRRALKVVACLLARNADGVRCLFRQAADDAVSAGAARDFVRVIPSRCDGKRFDPNATAGVARQTGRLLCVSNLVPEKGIGFLLDALPTVYARWPQATLQIVGDGPERARLQARAARLGVAHLIEFTGRVSQDQLPALLAAASVFVFPSLSEGTPRAVMEAMAMECCVVATTVGGIPDMIDHGSTGWLVPPADPAALAMGVSAALDSPAAREVGRRARAHVLARYTEERHVELMDALHRLALERRRSGDAVRAATASGGLL